MIYVIEYNENETLLHLPGPSVVKPAKGNTLIAVSNLADLTTKRNELQAQGLKTGALTLYLEERSLERVYD